MLQNNFGFFVILFFSAACEEAVERSSEGTPAKKPGPETKTPILTTPDVSLLDSSTASSKSESSPTKQPWGGKYNSTAKSMRNSSAYLCTSLELPKTKTQLPPGWRSMLHDTGIPVYYHFQSHVATFSRPFVVEREEHIRNKEPPLSSIPCLEYEYFLKAKNSLVEGAKGNEEVDSVAAG